jgi:hypothetical protein
MKYYTGINPGATLSLLYALSSLRKQYQTMGGEKLCPVPGHSAGKLALLKHGQLKRVDCKRKKELNDFQRNLLDTEILSNLRFGSLEIRDTSVARVTNNFQKSA